MGQPRLQHWEPKFVRDKVRQSFEFANELHKHELELILILREIDEHRFFVRVGCKSLQAYCIKALGFTRVQAQRIVTQVRRET